MTSRLSGAMKSAAYSCSCWLSTGLARVHRTAGISLAVMTPALLAVLLMYAAFAGVGWVAARKASGGTAADLLVAGRRMPLWVAALTMTATWVDGGYLLGTAEGAYKSSIQLGLQGGLCFGISLVLGGLFFAGTMRRHGFTTLIDPFESRFGARWAAVLFLPALAGELFWSASLLVAIGSTFGVLLNMNLDDRDPHRRRRDDRSTRCSAGCGRSPTPTSCSLGSSRSDCVWRCRSC